MFHSAKLCPPPLPPNTLASYYALATALSTMSNNNVYIPGEGNSNYILSISYVVIIVNRRGLQCNSIQCSEALFWTGGGLIRGWTVTDL